MKSRVKVKSKSGAAVSICKIKGCKNLVRTRGWCSKHYQKWLKHGDPAIILRTPKGEPMKFLRDIALPYSKNNCLIWPFGRGPKGYAGIWQDGNMRLVSRLICKLVYGPSPSLIHQAAHICGNGHLGCVNPHHLRWKTPSENKADELIHKTRARGERMGSAKLTEKQAIAIKKAKGTITEIARWFNIPRSRVYEIKSGKTWKHLS